MAEEPVKVGIISCAGEEIPEGTIARLAVRRVLEELRPGQVVSLCLPLFLAGDGGEREFARDYPTITIDGCDKRCAQWGTEKYSGPVSAACVVTEMLKEGPSLSGARSGRKLTEDDLAAVDLVAQRLAAAVDLAAGTHPLSQLSTADTSSACGCAGSLPFGAIQVDGKTVQIAGLPLIFQQCQEDGVAADSPETPARLLAVVRVYHAISDSEEQAYAAALAEAYRAFLSSDR
ncbi:MAG: putative zinc-binding protein [Armatimonadota bacterium]